MLRHLIIARLMPTCALMAWIAGCANLDAIQQFASQSVNAAQHSKLVDEYADAPLRLKTFEPADRHAELDKQIEMRRQQKAALLARLNAVEEYMMALGQLAADKAVDYDQDVDSVGKAVKDAKFIDASEADALGTISELLLRAGTDNWRQQKLRDLIEQADTPLQTVLKSQREIVAKDFAASLRIEETAIKAYYDNFVRPPDASSKEPAGVAALKELRDQRLQSFPRRQQAVADYARVLDKIAAAHHELFTSRNQLRNDLVLKQAQRYAKEIQAIMKVVKAL